MKLQIDDEDLPLFREALARGGPFTWPPLLLQTQWLDEQAWAVTVVPDVNGAMREVPLLVLISETGQPHIPAEIAALVETFNASPATSWLAVLADVISR